MLLKFQVLKDGDGCLLIAFNCTFTGISRNEQA